MTKKWKFLYYELIPDDEILESQFPDVLAELKNNEARRDEIEAMLKEVNDLEEDEYNEEDYEVSPKSVLKEFKDKLKELNGEIRAVNDHHQRWWLIAPGRCMVLI